MPVRRDSVRWLGNARPPCRTFAASASATSTSFAEGLMPFTVSSTRLTKRPAMFRSARKGDHLLGPARIDAMSEPFLRQSCPPRDDVVGLIIKPIFASASRVLAAARNPPALL